mmetsp:Transcript_68517/g.61563  ORF Transcript_68517/g.61563 Transcript_68517/m.61563 type:complete len:253 (+) Transcript_68517:44-802(+)
MSVVSQWCALPQERKQALFLLRNTKAPFDSTAGLNGFKKDDFKDLRLLLKELKDFAPFVIENQTEGEENKDESKETYNTKTFKYENDFDFNGILYWLGTEKGKVTNWTNPNDSKIVTVKASSGLTGGSTSTMIGRSWVSSYSKNEPMSWMEIDFGTVQIKGTHYSLRHGYNVADAYLMNWRLEGQGQHSEEWEVIRRHKNETTLKCQGRTGSWKLDTNVFYSKFRVIQYAGNNRPDNYLCLSGFEIYGTVKY